MRVPSLSLLSVLLAATVSQVSAAPAAAASSAVAVKGKAYGFATGTTGGGNAAAVYPSDIAELKKYLSDDVARVIVLNKEYNFISSEGKVTEQGCRPKSNTCVGNGGQDAINGANWCSGSDQTPVQVTYDKAGVQPLWIKSNKSVIGVGNKGVIRGKGLRVSNGASNVIIQNVHVTELNPQYIWGGDAFAIDDADKVWIDHCQTSLIGRQHVVIGNGPGTHVTISNHYFDGRTSWSASCNGHHYWTMILGGSKATVTIANNWFRSVSGRSPKISSTTDGTTVVHAVNNWFYDNPSGHAFDISTNTFVLAEGNVFQNVDQPLLEMQGQLFANGGTACQSALGRSCQTNQVIDSGAFSGASTGALSHFKGVNAVTPSSTSVVANNVSKNAGIGKI
ncbi:hypothetical protein AAFC00_005191 [Neodothiora populina]|uniref:pectin lyase n=1 Tax=Neodothiora populina TaxID=2781224 RepID=A0ABR3PK27_9PEZI